MLMRACLFHKTVMILSLNILSLPYRRSVVVHSTIFSRETDFVSLYTLAQHNQPARSLLLLPSAAHSGVPEWMVRVTWCVAASLSLPL